MAPETFVHCEIYAEAKVETVTEDYMGLGFELAMLDTRKRDKKRHLLPLASVRGKVILGPTDDRLDEPADTRLTGLCYRYILSYLSC